MKYPCTLRGHGSTKQHSTHEVSNGDRRALTSPICCVGVELKRLPAEQALTKFEKTKKESGQETGLVAELMSKLQGNGDSTKVMSSSMCMTGGLSALPKKSVDKILTGEFNDLANLPPAKGRVRTSTYAIEGEQSSDLQEIQYRQWGLQIWQCLSVPA